MLDKPNKTISMLMKKLMRIHSVIRNEAKRSQSKIFPVVISVYAINECLQMRRGTKIMIFLSCNIQNVNLFKIKSYLKT